MRSFTLLRVVAVLKRIALALEANNTLVKERLEREFPSHKSGPRIADFSVASAQDWNAQWEKDKWERT